jgi:hypothetical protein
VSYLRPDDFPSTLEQDLLLAQDLLRHSSALLPLLAPLALVSVSVGLGRFSTPGFTGWLTSPLPFHSTRGASPGQVQQTRRWLQQHCPLARHVRHLSLRIPVPASYASDGLLETASIPLELFGSLSSLQAVYDASAGEAAGSLEMTRASQLNLGGFGRMWQEMSLRAVAGPETCLEFKFLWFDMRDFLDLVARHLVGQQPGTLSFRTCTFDAVFDSDYLTASHALQLSIVRTLVLKDVVVHGETAARALGVLCRNLTTLEVHAEVPLHFLPIGDSMQSLNLERCWLQDDFLFLQQRLPLLAQLRTLALAFDAELTLADWQRVLDSFPRGLSTVSLTCLEPFPPAFDTILLLWLDGASGACVRRIAASAPDAAGEEPSPRRGLMIRRRCRQRNIELVG